MAYLSSYAAGRNINYFSQNAYSSGLEERIADYHVSLPAFNHGIFLYQKNPARQYKKEEGKSYYSAQSHAYIMHEPFLNPVRPATQFINKASEIRDFVEEAFRKTTNQELPDDFTIEILKEEEFRTIKKEKGVLGFAINRKKSGMSRIVVRENNLDVLMIVVGHEIGHILTGQALTLQDEEAKAFSFQFAWAKTIFEHDIAGLRMSINSGIFQPAQNGMHDIAFSFVQKLISSGRKSLEIYGLIAAGIIGMNNWGLVDF